MSFLPQSRSVCAFLLFAYSVLLTVTAEAAPKRLICEAETGKAAARYWSEQAARNRAYGKTKQAEQMERTAAFCEDAAFSRQIAIHFDDTDTLLGTEHWLISKCKHCADSSAARVYRQKSKSTGRVTKCLFIK